MRPALFLDRDGVINVDTNFLYKWEECVFIDGIASLIATANRLGYAVVVVTNQSGIGRGLYTEEDFHALTRSMNAALLEQGARIDAVYFSPFHPKHGLGDYKRDTDCRKPAPGMLLRAAQEHGIDLPRSLMVGDRCTDLQAGANAGISALFLFGNTESTTCEGVVYTGVGSLSQIESYLEANTNKLPS